jgi:hypothetical protein
MAGNLESLVGNSGGAIGNVVGLASSFQQLGLSPDMVFGDNYPVRSTTTILTG